ncbi:stage V sporulation protein K [Amphibacillus marinus]|uniref:Stage V sporulation protein K n=1 Tax=Amphibacillus marinus TaxID=872970 RepID=A0A1H8HDI3_9BACI|nr:AAA family ATPase [Amphibacillus marinus]SEN54175.1 stage V sporulation protein K [Amphibacillus marinus]
MNVRANQINIVLKQQDNQAITSRPTHDPFEIVHTAMEGYIGMQSLRQKIKEIYAFIAINKRRDEVGLKIEKHALHMLFKGNPGTGKTTVARTLAKLFVDLGVLEQGHVIEAERADLVGEYIGQTANKTRALIQRAKGGVLFIDEAYALARGSKKDFGKEAIDTLVKQMEDHHQSFILILAGYPNEMLTFLRTNPGLASRFPFILDFPDYTVDELIRIAKKMIKMRDYHLTTGAEASLRTVIDQEMNKKTTQSFSNGRFIRNVIEQAIRNQSVRLIQQRVYDVKELILLKADDFEVES